MKKLGNYFLIAVYLFAVVGFSPARAGSYNDFVTAIKRDHRHIVEALLQRGFDPNTVDEQGQPGIVAALLLESYQVAAALAESPQLQLEAANPSGETALMMASLRGQTALVQRLLERGAAVNRPGWSPLHYAASAPDDDALKLLLQRGAAVDARAPNGMTPLMMAASVGPSTAVDLLLAAGAQPGLRNDQGQSAADCARQQGRDWLADRLERLMNATPPAR